MPNLMTYRVLYSLLLLGTLVSCGGSSSSTSPEPTMPPVPPPIVTPVTNIPTIISTQVNAPTVGRYEKIEWSIDANAE